jgi:hypothetical protein
MSTTILTNYLVANTYGGVMHAQGEQVPGVGQVYLYDGLGNQTSIKVGRFSAGATINGLLSSGRMHSSGLKYPIGIGNIYDIVYQSDTEGQLDLIDINELVQSHTPSFPPFTVAADGTYYNPSKLVIRDGLITSILDGYDSRTFYYNLSPSSFTVETGATWPTNGQVGTFIETVWPIAGVADATRGRTVDIPNESDQAIVFVTKAKRQLGYNISNNWMQIDTTMTRAYIFKLESSAWTFKQAGTSNDPGLTYYFNGTSREPAGLIVRASPALVTNTDPIYI